MHGIRSFHSLLAQLRSLAGYLIPELSFFGMRYIRESSYLMLFTTLELFEYGMLNNCVT